MSETMNTGTPADYEDAKHLDRCLGEFASNLETAQTLWRRYPGLVEAAAMPAEMIAALVPRDDSKPDYEMDYAESRAG